MMDGIQVRWHLHLAKGGVGWNKENGSKGKPMNRTMKMAMVGMAVVLAGLGVAMAQEVQANPAVVQAPAIVKQTTCPVMEGNPINPEIYADANGKRVYFCCHACQAEFKANPEKYIEKLEKQGVTLDPTLVAPAAIPAPS
jgi:YHS domain-containing protein